MTARDLATVALRIAGPYLVLQVLAALSALFYAVPMVLDRWQAGSGVVEPGLDWEAWRSIVLIIWPAILYAAIALGLLRGAPRLANQLVPAQANEPGRIVLGPQLEAAAISVVGIVVLARTAPGLVYAMVMLLMAAKHRGTPYFDLYWNPVGWRHLLEVGGSIVVGLWLCLGARGIANAIRFLRQAGTASP